jgi:DNA-binding protein H-NS
MKIHLDNCNIRIQIPKTYIERINMLLSELLTKNESIVGQLNKVEAEIVKRIADLQAAVDTLTQQLGNIELTPEQTASVEALQTAVDSLDNIVPDSVPPIE